MYEDPPPTERFRLIGLRVGRCSSHWDVWTTVGYTVGLQRALDRSPIGTAFGEAPHADDQRPAGHLAKIGIIAPIGYEVVNALVALVKDQGDPRVPTIARIALVGVVAMLEGLGGRVAQLDCAIRAAHKASPTSLRLESISGVGPLLDSAVVATVGDGAPSDRARAFSAWTGLTPHIEGTGGNTTTGRITKQGEHHLRRLLILGAASVLMHARHHPSKHPAADRLLARMDFKQAAVALAKKIARTIWALMIRSGTHMLSHQPLALAPRV